MGISLLFPISPGYYSSPKRNRKQCVCKLLVGGVGGGGEGVNKVHYGICENDESGALFHALQG